MNANHRRRRLLRGAVILVVAWLAVRGVPAAVRGIRDARWELTDRVALLERYRAELARAINLEDSALTLQRSLQDQASRLVGGGSEADANDALASLVSVAVTNANARLQRAEPLADSTRRGLLHGVRVLASFDADVRGVMTVLESLAGETPSLVVESLDVLVVDPNAPATAPEVLRVELVVRGWYLEQESGG